MNSAEKVFEHCSPIHAYSIRVLFALNIVSFFASGKKVGVNFKFYFQVK